MKQAIIFMVAALYITGLSSAEARRPLAILQPSNVKLPVAIPGTREGDIVFLITMDTDDRDPPLKGPGAG
jgi:hypothetical protein